MNVQHIKLLENYLLDFTKEASDIYIVSHDGEVIETHKILLSFHSELMRSIFKSLESSTNHSLYLPLSSGSIKSLLEILATGKAVSKVSKDLIEVNEAAKILGIPFKAWDLGSDLRHPKSIKEETEDLEEDDVFLPGRVFTKYINNEIGIYEIEDKMSKQEKRKLSAVSDTLARPGKKVKKEAVNAVKRYEAAPSDRKRHVKAFHCEHCAKTFTKKKPLKRHLERKVCQKRIAKADYIFQKMKSVSESLGIRYH